MEEQSSLSWWLKERCKREHLSLRQAGERAGLSHSTIHCIMNGGQASAQTVRKLAQGFSDNRRQRQALEDKLLVLAGCRSERPGGEELSEALAQLMDKVEQFSEPRLKMMGHFADFLIKIEGGSS